MPIVRLPGGDLRDEIRQTIYDTLTIAGTTSGLSTNPGTVGTSVNDFNGERFFAVANGKQLWQTNLRQNGMLETAVSYRVQGIAMDAQYLNTNALDNRNDLFYMFSEYTALTIKIGEKQYWEGPCIYLMGRIDANLAISVIPPAALPVAADTRSRQFYRAGQLAVQGLVLSGRHVVDINPLQTFEGIMQASVPSGMVADADFTTNAQALNARLSFKGLMRRPVQ